MKRTYLLDILLISLKIGSFSICNLHTFWSQRISDYSNQILAFINSLIMSIRKLEEYVADDDEYRQYVHNPVNLFGTTCNNFE